MSSSIELNKSSPTLTTLVKIAGAFGKQVNFFLDEILTHDAVVLRKNERRELRKEIGKSFAEPLTKLLDGQKMKATIYTLDKSSNGHDTGKNFLGDTLIYILEGSLEVSLSREMHELESGDSIYIMAEEPFKWKNSAGKRTRFIMVVSSVG